MAVHTSGEVASEARTGAKQRAKSNETLIALLRSWREDDSEPVAGQHETLVKLLRSLDERQIRSTCLGATAPEEAPGLLQ